jgi:hypothetical protein
LIQKYNIPAALVINLDQFGQRLLSVLNRTRVTKGTKTVGILGVEDKRQITGVAAAAMNGKFLGIHAIWQGKTDRCHPKSAESHSCLIHTHSANHWSTLGTMKDFVTRLVLPYVKGVIEELRLPQDQHSVLMVDMWKVHLSAEFRDFLSKCTPPIEVNYIEAGTTPKGQRTGSRSNLLTF